MIRKVQAAKKAATPPVNNNSNNNNDKALPKTYIVFKKPFVTDLREIDTDRLAEVSARTKWDTEFLETQAGFEGVRPRNYECYGGNTVGIGHFVNGDPQLKGKKDILLTQAEIYDTYAKDLLKKEEEIKKALPNFGSLSIGKREALMDLFFNSKPSALTGIIDAVAQERFDDAVKKMAIIYSGGKASPGLGKRRMNNIVRFASGDDPKVALTVILGIAAKFKGRKDVQQAAQDAQKKLKAARPLNNPPQTPVIASDN